MRAYLRRELSALDARVLRATDARYDRSPEKIGELAGVRGGCGAVNAAPAPRPWPGRGRWRAPAAVAAHP
jgi:hypothetical protein